MPLRGHRGSKKPLLQYSTMWPETHGFYWNYALFVVFSAARSEAACRPVANGPGTRLNREKGL